MKKIIYIFSAALLCLVSCSRENVPMQYNQTINRAPQDGDLARVTFYVTVPESELYATQTRAGWNDPFAEEPKGIADGDLFVAVFGKGSTGTVGIGGQLQNVVKARLMKDFATENPKGKNPPIDHNYTDGEYVYAYEVLLPISEEPLVLDFFAGAYDSEGNIYNLDNPLPVDYEANVMPLLRSIDGNAAYWQRVEIQGVFPKPDPNNPGGYISAQVLDDDGNVIPQEDPDYEADDIPQLHNIRLVRNFAKVTFTKTAEAQFDIKGFYLVNTPVEGTVAPFSGSMGYANAYTTTVDAAVIMNSYQGYITNTELTSGIPDIVPFVDPGTYVYMYERPVPDLNRPLGETGAILDITWHNDADEAILSKLGDNLHRYYKVSFINKDGAVPILRNIVYNFQVSAIAADRHPESAAAAYASPFLGDISANVATSMLDEITNNKSLIKVSEMSKTFIGEGGEDNAVDINFWFYPDVKNHPNDVVVNHAASYQGQTVTIQVILEDVSGHQPAVASWTNTTPTSGATMGTIHVVPNSSAEGAVKKSKIKILGQWGTQRALYREVEFTVMEKQSFAQGSVVCTVSTLAADEVDQNVTVTIALPDELPRDIFPLNIMIEPQNNGLRSIPYNGESALPVQHGESAFNSNRHNYYFVKTITYDDYATLNESGSSYDYRNEFPCYFVTRLKKGNETAIKINDLDKQYFVESTVNLSL